MIQDGLRCPYCGEEAEHVESGRECGELRRVGGTTKRVGVDSFWARYWCQSCKVVINVTADRIIR